jgi:hypothetical protein
MSRSVGYFVLGISLALVAILAIFRPSTLSDHNLFLAGFVTHELLSILGVILAITIASAGQLHLTLNEVERLYKSPGAFNKTRRGVHSAAYVLIGLFLAALAVVLIKPLVPSAEWSQSIFNGLAVVILIWNALILISITQTIFAIKD